METLKHKKDKMQVVKYLYLLGTLFLIITCKSTKVIKEDDHYKVEVYKKKDSPYFDSSAAYLHLQAFHYENKKKMPFTAYRINKIIFPSTIQKSNKLTLDVLPGNFEIECGLFGKEWARLKDFKINRRDSIVITFYLEDFKEPMINNEGMVTKQLQKKTETAIEF